MRLTIDLSQWDRLLTLKNGRPVHVRPIKPDDARLYEDFFRAEDIEDLRLRFFGAIRRRDGTFFKSFTNIDYSTAMAFIALDEDNTQMLGVVRLHDSARVDGEAEFAIIVRSDLKSLGLGWSLMKMMIAYACAKGLRVVRGQVLRENGAMLDMCRELGFAVTSEQGASYVANVSLQLTKCQSHNQRGTI